MQPLHTDVLQIKTICHHINYIYMLSVTVYVYGGTRMTQPTSAVSLRITEEDLALLDARVGLDGPGTDQMLFAWPSKNFFTTNPN